MRDNETPPDDDVIAKLQRLCVLAAKPPCVHRRPPPPASPEQDMCYSEPRVHRHPSASPEPQDTCYSEIRVRHPAGASHKQRTLGLPPRKARAAPNDYEYMDSTGYGDAASPRELVHTCIDFSKRHKRFRKLADDDDDARATSCYSDDDDYGDPAYKVHASMSTLS